MVEVVSRSRMPSVPRQGSPAPGEVLFKRGVRSTGVAVTGSEVVPAQRPVQFSVDARVSRGIPVASVLNVLRCVRLRVRSVASEFRVEPPLSAPVQSASQSRAYPVDRFGLPASTLPLVLRSLKRRAAAAKVLRGRRRLGEATEPARVVVPVAYAFGQMSRDDGRGSSSSDVASRCVASSSGVRVQSFSSVASEWKSPAARKGPPYLQ